MGSRYVGCSTPHTLHRSLQEVSSPALFSAAKQGKIVFGPRNSAVHIVFEGEDMQHTSSPASLASALREVARQPVHTLLEAWNWKAAATSAMVRGSIFLATNLHAGPVSAIRALLVEGVFATFASGTLGAVTQRVRKAHPLWATMLFIWAALPVVMIAAEYAVHRLAGTTNMRAGLIASFACAAVASGFTWYAMHRGVMLAGEQSTTVAHDLRTLPGVAWDFAMLPARLVWRR